MDVNISEDNPEQTQDTQEVWEYLVIPHEGEVKEVVWE